MLGLLRQTCLRLSTDPTILLAQHSAATTMILLLVFVLVFIIGAAPFCRRFRLSLARQNRPFPPGPKPSWIINNANQMPQHSQWLTFAKWGNIHGGLVFIRIFTTPFLIINSSKAAFDLLDNRSNIFSDRPQSIMANELIGWDFNMTLMGYGDMWRKHRKVMHQALHSRAVQQYQPLQLQETKKFIRKLAVDPMDFLKSVRHLAGATIMMMAYGHELRPHDPYVTLAEDAVEGLTRTLGVGFLVDAIPSMRFIPSWFPGANFRRKASRWRLSTRGLLELPWAALKQRIASGEAIPCYCTNLLEATGKQPDPQAEAIVKETAAVLYAAGSDSTTALISSFFLAMTLHPHVQSKAQDELDRVVGRSRLPSFADRGSLPYLECLLSEIYRWNPAAPLGVAHRLSRDDVYEGYFIPAGTTVIPNLWAMLHDPEMYPDPYCFRPERFAECDEETFKAIDPRNFMFGFGRRICPGQFFADAAVYIALASVLSVFRISKATDKIGAEIIPEVDYPAFVGHPKPFRCCVKIRPDLQGDLLDILSIEQELTRLGEEHEVGITRDVVP